MFFMDHFVYKSFNYYSYEVMGGYNTAFIVARAKSSK